MYTKTEDVDAENDSAHRRNYRFGRPRTSVPFGDEGTRTYWKFDWKYR